MCAVSRQMQSRFDSRACSMSHASCSNVCPSDEPCPAVAASSFSENGAANHCMLFFTNTCIAVQPTDSARSIALSTPPAIDMCAPSSGSAVVLLFLMLLLLLCKPGEHEQEQEQE